MLKNLQRKKVSCNVDDSILSSAELIHEEILLLFRHVCVVVKEYSYVVLY